MKDYMDILVVRARIEGIEFFGISMTKHKIEDRLYVALDS